MAAGYPPVPTNNWSCFVPLAAGWPVCMPTLVLAAPPALTLSCVWQLHFVHPSDAINEVLIAARTRRLRHGWALRRAGYLPGSSAQDNPEDEVVSAL